MIIEIINNDDSYNISDFITVNCLPLMYLFYCYFMFLQIFTIPYVECITPYRLKQIYVKNQLISSDKIHIDKNNLNINYLDCVIPLKYTITYFHLLHIFNTLYLILVKLISYFC